MKKRLSAGALLLAAGGAWTVTGCGGAAGEGGAAASPGTHEASAIRAHTCVKCHAAPEPGDHTRAELEVIFGRHRARAKLTEDQWTAMVDLLGRADETPGAR